MKIQNYKQGHIERVRESYHYVENGKVKGIYLSIGELVADYDKQNQPPKKRRTYRKKKETPVVAEAESTEVAESPS